MKKLVFMFAAVVALSFASCEEAGKGGNDSDSLGAALDSLVSALAELDSAVADLDSATAAIDSIAE